MTLRRKAAWVVGGATLVFLGCDYFNRLDALFCLALLFTVLTFIARMLAAAFSSNSAERMRSQPDFHVLWGLLALGGLYWTYNMVQWGIPDWAYRSAQRRMVLARIEPVGGWKAVREGCQTLLADNPDIYEWRLWNGQLLSANSDTSGFLTNVNSQMVPIALRKLSPQSIKLGLARDVPGTKVVRMKVLGMHSTGGYSDPYYGLEVVFGTNVESYRPKISGVGGVSGNRYSTYRKVADGIYEIY